MKKRIVWNDICKKIGREGEYMGGNDIKFFRTALILTGNYQDEVQVYDGVTQQAKKDLERGYYPLLKQYIDAVKEVASE